MPHSSSETAQSDYSFITPSIRRDAEEYSRKEGVSLQEFINVALAERLSHLRHQEWMSTRRPITPERTASFLALLDKAGNEEVQPGDEIPEGYVRR